ncbi:MAG TPA: VIT1/CCC1 family protein [Egibacteraceae bacterium]|nr:VIT1/CCC1 family protein [Egibacteraceae bacterium]
MATGEELSRYRRLRQDEIDSAALYRAMAEGESQPQLAEVYRRLAAVEERHAAFWEQALRRAGRPPGSARPGWRARALSWLARHLGAQWVLPTVAAAEHANQHVYDRRPEARATGMRADERSHARVLRLIAGRSLGGLEGSAVARLEGRHHTIGGNALRAAVLGANDGLVSNLSLVMGVAGAGLGSRAILITGAAGLLAGAGSMALGEWLSVQSSRELYQRQIEVEAEEIAAMPEEEEEELVLIYQAKGLPEVEARALARRLMADQATALDTMAREELGVDPEELGGSAWEAAIASFLLFAAGAAVPVAPFLFLAGAAAVAGSLVAGAFALFLIGAAITLLTGRSALLSGARQLLFGLAAAALTFGLGSLLGAAVTG